MNDSKLNVVLHREGDSSPITLNQDKCLIRTVHDNQKVDCCAIFNGPYGTALRSYADNVLVNGEPTAVRWLNAGDQIQLPCSSRIEVKEATLQRPVLAQPPTVNDEVEQPVAISPVFEAPAVEVVPTVEVPAVEIPAVETSSDEETFHSPFSQDLPTVEAPVADVQPAEAPVVEAPVVEQESQPVEAVETETQSDELESIFARMGVTNVGSIANPGAAAQEPVASTPVETVAPVEAPVTITENTETDAAASIREELASLFADVEPIVETPEPSVAVEPVAVEPSVPMVPPAMPTPAPAAIPELVQPQPTPQPEATTQPEASQIPTISADLSSLVDQPASDPLAELPDDLRNQLNSLVSTLESESPTPNPSVGVDASVIAGHAAVSIPAIPELENPQPTHSSEPAGLPSVEMMIPEPIQAASEVVADVAEEATPPVRDPSISSMFEEAMRAIQGDTAAAEPAAVESVTPVNTVETPAALEPTPAVAEVPVVPEPVVVPETPTFVDVPEASDFPAAVEVPELVEVPEIVEAVVEAPAEKPQSQSVADILGAMGMAVPGQNEPETATPEPFASIPTPSPTPEPTPVQQSIPATPDPVSTQEASLGGNGGGGNAEDDVQAYMNKLLNRGTPTAAPAEDSSEPVANEPVAAPVVATREVQKVLSEEEFVPTHKPSRPQNYDTLREIANTSSRTAIKTSHKRAQKESVMMKLVFGLLSLLLAGGTFWFQLHVVSGVCLAVTAMCVVSCFLKKETSDPNKAVVTMTKMEA